LIQQPPIASYNVNPEAAWITDMAIIKGKHHNDPLAAVKEISYPLVKY